MNLNHTSFIKTVVLVEDDYALSSLIKYKVEEKSLNFVSFSHGKDALDYIKKNADHILVIIDYELPDTNGLLLIEEIKKYHPRVPFIAITGAGSEKVASQFLRLGVFDYIVKDLGFLEHFDYSIDNIIQKLNLQYLNDYQQRIIAEKELKYQLLFNNILDVYLLINKDLKFIEVSPSIYELIQVPAEMLLNQPFFYITPNKKEWKEVYKKLIKYNVVNNFEIQISNKANNIKKTCLLNAKLVNHFENTFAVATLRDISELKQLQKELTQVSSVIEEQERKALAENLHDMVAPLLSVAKMQLSRLQDENKTEIEKKQIIEETVQIIDEAVYKIRSISNDMMNNILTEYGLEKSIMRFVQRFIDMKCPKISFSFNSTTKRFHPYIENIIYRTTIELINNGVKHSKAQNLNLSITEKKGVLMINYQDDGIGFDFNTNDFFINNKGQGLYSMHYRIRNIGGNILFKRLEQGVNFEIEIPLNENSVN